jgi:two-component system chemotaxis sensor kinase CheA
VMSDNFENSGDLADDLAEFLPTFLDETEEQLDDLVETMLALERDSTSKDDLNEAFRLIHSIKGSAGMMGFDSMMILTHHLESRFARFRSGQAQLDEPTMGLVLRCVDYLRQCNNRLRDGEPLVSSSELLDELKRLEAQADTVPAAPSEQQAETPPSPEGVVTEEPVPAAIDELEADDAVVRMVVCFRSDLQLADLKAQLIVSRLSGLGEIKATRPELDHVSETEHFQKFEVVIETDAGVERLRAAADVDGVESIEFEGVSTESVGEETAETQGGGEGSEKPPEIQAEIDANNHIEEAKSAAESVEQAGSDRGGPGRSPDVVEPPAPEKSPAKMAETMRVDISRLDNLMNLAGELVVNRARFVQISGQISPALRKASMVNRIRDFSDNIRRTIEDMENGEDAKGDWSTQIQQLREGLELMDEQAEVWNNGRQCITQICETIDQLSRVSHSLQRGVLGTRMVPVAPLFNRFKRVVRDLSKERGKKVNLVVRGEKTELDKRMIDELGDPLVHLVRNSIDHGLEPPDVRVSRGKPEVGTILLEASHSGNNVYIQIRDDGGGIDVEKIKAKLLANRLLSEEAINGLSDEQALDYIWHPGFSTAKKVTDVSGRGVGMDVVKTRIGQLNGTVEVETVFQRGTTFTLRLPLTLAIIDALLVRLRSVVFSMPIDDVREIVSVKERDVVSVHGKQTIDVRGEFIPLVSIDGIFQWHAVDYGHRCAEVSSQTDQTSRTVDVVILHARGKTMGLRVDELLGSQDIVIKSLSDNFINIRGLSGASILGDGSVCLMLDVGTVIDLAMRTSRTESNEEVAT